MRINHYIFVALVAVMLSACEHEVNLDKYRDKDSENLLTLNAMICPDSTVKVSATKTYFFSDVHQGRTYVKDLSIAVAVDGAERGSMNYDEANHLYVSNVKVNPGEAVTVSTTYQGKAVTATDVMPQPVAIEDISVARQGPMSVYTDTDFIFTYGITFSDSANESNYYFLQWDEVEPSKDVRMGERDFTYEFVFQQLANEVHATLPGWTPYCAYGLPFSDKGIEGERHTITVKEIVQMALSADWQKTQMKRKFKLYSISKAYYDYLFSVLINQTNDKGIQGGLIDLGIVNPVKAYTNIDGGIGIMGCYTTAERVLDVMEIVGPFPTGK